MAMIIWRIKNLTSAILGATALMVFSAACGSSSKHASPSVSASTVSASATASALASAAPSTSDTALATPSSPAAGLPTAVLASIQLDPGSAPAPMTVGYGSVWVGSHRANTLYRIDPTTDRIAAKIDLGQASCENMMAFDDRIWIGYCDGSTKEMVVSASTNQVVASIPSLGVFGDLDGTIWATSNDGTQLQRLDPTTYQVIATIDAPGTKGVVGGGYVWVANESFDTAIYDGTISKVDPATNQVVATLHTATYLDPFLDYDVASKSIWLKGENDHSLTAVDTTTGLSRKIVLDPYDALSSFADDPPVSGLGSIWVRTTNDVMARLDPQSGLITAQFPATGAGGWPVVGFGSLWVANFDADSVWRVQVPS
jgi:streptogramin lyase